MSRVIEPREKPLSDLRVELQRKEVVNFILSRGRQLKLSEEEIDRFKNEHFSDEDDLETVSRKLSNYVIKLKNPKVPAGLPEDPVTNPADHYALITAASAYMEELGRCFELPEEQIAEFRESLMIKTPNGGRFVDISKLSVNSINGYFISFKLSLVRMGL